MANQTIIEIPDFDFSGFYYADILRALIIFTRQNVPEITDESDEEPFTQLLRAFALVGHLNNTLLDIQATETLLPSARLLESVRGHLRLIDVTLEQNKPASVEIIFELSKIFTVLTNYVPVGTQVATEETVDQPQVIYEADSDNFINPTNAPTAVFSFKPAQITINSNVFDVGDKVSIRTVDFIPGTDFAVGLTTTATAANLATAINNSSNANIQGKVYAYNIGNRVIVMLKDLDLADIALVETDGATDNFTVSNGAYSVNRAGDAVNSALLFDMFEVGLQEGSCFYVLHSDIMWDTIEFITNTFGSGFEGVWEFYDGEGSEKNPDSVTNLGANLEMDLTALLGTDDRTGTLIQIVYSGNGATEEATVQYIGGVNIIRTQGLLGQITVSTLANDYLVGTLWNEVKDLTDTTENFTKVRGKVAFSLPQSLSQNWVKTSINNIQGYPLRYRIISVSAPVTPELNIVDITKGKQFLIFDATQGESRTEEPLASSNGSSNQEFELTFSPLLVESLVVEVDEGTGFTEWNKVENFLTSTQISKDYALEVLADDTAIIRFGDGKTGKIPAVGVDNIRAFYRIGGDVNGNVGALVINVNKSGVPFVNRVYNPRAAIGHEFKEGSTEEDLARLKIEGPATLRVRDRAITPDDYEFLATRFTDTNGSSLVVRALAIEETFGVKTIEIVIVGVAGTLLTQAQLDEVNDYFNGNKVKGIKGRGLTNHEATAVNYTPKVIDVTAVVEGGNKAEIENALKALLNPEAKFSDAVTKRWDFGDLVPRAIIISEIINVDPQNIKNVTLTTPPTDIQLGTRELPMVGNLNITVL